MERQQQSPKGDARYRVHRSARCYVAELMVGTGGASWYFDDSVERKVYLDLVGREFVVYKTRYYPLQPAERMIEIVKMHSRLKGGVVSIGMKPFYWDEDSEFTAHPFIDLTSQAEHARFRALVASKAAP
jgi:hypothetical protein